MQPPFFGFGFYIVCNFPPNYPRHQCGSHPNRIDMLRYTGDPVIRPGFPEPVGGRFGIVAKALVALAESFFGALAFRHVDDKDNPLVSCLPEKGSADQNRHAAPILAKIFLLVRLAGPGQPQLGYRIPGCTGPPGAWQLRPPSPTRNKIFAEIARQDEKGLLGFDDPAVRRPGHDSDGLRV